MPDKKDRESSSVLVTAFVTDDADGAAIEERLQARFGTKSVRFLGWTESEGRLWRVVAFEPDALIAERDRVAIDSAVDRLRERWQASHDDRRGGDKKPDVH